MKSKTTPILLCFFLGVLGIHRFYLGHTLIGVIQLLTFGGFGIWALIDFFRLIFGSIQVNTGDTDRTIDAMNEKNSEIAESINTLNQKTSVLQEKLEETTEEGEEIDDNLQGKRSGIDEKIVVNSGQTGGEYFVNAFDVIKFEGRRWNLLKSMKSFPFVMMILLVIGQVSWRGSQTVEEMRSWIGVMSLFSLWFIIKLIKKSPAKVNLSLDDDQKEKLKNILESIKKVEPITMFRETKVLNQGETEIDFAHFTANGKSAYFLPEGIAYGSGKNFELLDYKNLSVKQKTIEVVEDKLPKGANPISDRVVKKPVEVEKSKLPKGSKVIESREKNTPVYGGWTHQNKDGSKNKRFKENPRKVAYYKTTKYVTYNEETKYVKYIKTDLNITLIPVTPEEAVNAAIEAAKGGAANELKIELLGDYNFPSLKTKNEKEAIIVREKEEEEKRREQESIKETLKREQERIKKEKEKEERDKKMKWEREITDKIANVSAKEAKEIKEKEEADGNLSVEQYSGPHK